MSGGAPQAVAGLGLVDGSLSVHLDGEPERWPAYRQAIATGKLPAGYAVDDCAALVLHGTRVGGAVSSRPGARVIRIRADGAGSTIEQELPVKTLPGSQPAEGPMTAAEPYGVSELRALRAGRHRWD
jgi:hypothetical protein